MMFTAETPATVPPHARLGLGRYASVWVTFAFALYISLLPLAVVPRSWTGYAISVLMLVLSTLMFMWLQLLVCARVAADSTTRLNVLGVLVAVIIWFVCANVRAHHGNALAVYTPQLEGYILRHVMQLCLSLFCVFAGCLLSKVIRERNMILPVAIAAIPIDYLGAMTPFGFTANVVSHHPSIIRAVTVAVPVAHGNMLHGIQPAAVVGPGDILFMAFFLCSVHRLQMNDRLTFWYMYAGISAAMICVVLLPHFNIAALVPIGISVIAANWKLMNLKREEIFATIYATGFVIVLAVMFYWYTNRFYFGRH